LTLPCIVVFVEEPFELIEGKPTNFSKISYFKVSFSKYLTSD
jgi:hypothetical protein